MTAWPRPRSLAFRWLALQFASLLVVLSAVATYAYWLLDGVARANIEMAGTSVVETVTGFASVERAWAENGGLQAVVLRLVNRVPTIRRVSVVHRTLGLIADSAPTFDGATERSPAVVDTLAGERVPSAVVDAAGRSIVRVTRGIEGPYDPAARSAIVGVAIVDVDLSRSNTLLRSVIVQSAVLFGGAITALWLFQFVAIRRLLLVRLNALRLAAARFGGGDLAARVAVGTADELGDVERSFNGMADHVQRSVSVMSEAERMKTDFVSFASHQLRTPLSGLNWMLELAVSTPGLPDGARHYLDDARASSDRLVHLVNDLLNVSRLESGRLHVDIESVDLVGLTREVVGTMEPQARAKSHELRVHALLPRAQVAADPQLLRETLVNLVSNAVKYTPSGGRITISLTRDNGLVRWAVTDTGIGIPAAQQARLFEKFFRADNAVTIEVEGTGLGLSFARLVVERFHGRLWCESEEGRGATFIFTLPVEGGR